MKHHYTILEQQNRNCPLFAKEAREDQSSKNEGASTIVDSIRYTVPCVLVPAPDLQVQVQLASVETTRYNRRFFHRTVYRNVPFGLRDLRSRAARKHPFHIGNICSAFAGMSRQERGFLVYIRGALITRLSLL